MSALPPEADIRQPEWQVNYVPKADMCPQSSPSGSDGMTPILNIASYRRVLACAEALQVWLRWRRRESGDDGCQVPRVVPGALILRQIRAVR